MKIYFCVATPGLSVSSLAMSAATRQPGTGDKFVRVTPGVRDSNPERVTFPLCCTGGVHMSGSLVAEQIVLNIYRANSN